MNDDFSFDVAQKTSSPEMANSRPDSSSPPASASEEIIKKHRGRKPLTDAERLERSNAKAQSQALAQFDPLFQPETWQGIVRGPADLMLFSTGNKIWNVTDGETKTLANLAAVNARIFGATNPKWLALAMLGIAIIQVYGSRTALYMAEKRAEREEQKKKETKNEA